jgi:homoserine kinase
LKEIHLKAPATIANVGPGFDIFAISLKEPNDEFIIKLTDSDSINIEISDGADNIPTTPLNNTGSLALVHLLGELGIKRGIHILIKKRMPVAAGLGSSGASASACVYGLNKLLNIGLSVNQIIDIARKGETASGGSPHADNVAGSLLGGFVFIKSYDPMDVEKIEIPTIPIVINLIKKKERTTRGFITGELPLSEIREQTSGCASVIHYLMQRDIEGFGKAISSDYISEPVRSKQIPDYWEIKKCILNAGAFGFNISGGGSSVFAVCDRKNQDKIAEVLEREFKKRGVKPQIIKTETSNEGIKEIK